MMPAFQIGCGMLFLSTITFPFSQNIERGRKTIQVLALTDDFTKVESTSIICSSHGI